MSGIDPPTRGRRGLSLVEAVIAVGITGVLVVAIMNAAGAAGARRAAETTKRAADAVADGVMSDLLALPIDDPDAVAESGVTRASHDNLLDFAAWRESPPADRYGATVAGTKGCTLMVTVLAEDPVTPAADAAAQGLYHVTVTVTKNNAVLAESHAYRCRAWDEARM